MKQVSVLVAMMTTVMVKNTREMMETWMVMSGETVMTGVHLQCPLLM